MEVYGFNAMLARMKYIDRWSLMRNAMQETLCEHAADTAILAHTLCLIACEVCGNAVRAEKVACAALYHDAGEILTGDMPTPVKYRNEELRSAYKRVEHEAAGQLTAMLPAPLQQSMNACLTGSELTDYEKKLLKAADRLSALLKCVDERRAGNHEFTGAEAQQRSALEGMQMPEIEYFMQHMLPAYESTLDELSGR